MKQQQKLSLFFTLKKLAVETEKHEDGLDKDGGEAAGEVSLIMSLVQNYNGLTQTITEMIQFKVPCGTYIYNPFWLPFSASQKHYCHIIFHNCNDY